ncbi:hypothetical protein GCM10009639_14340 [Kitasatospora putterlickiae]|uniref:Uncharacterized protein n=1 Tax=Kitasatospora putterlickiae TaxID=221725 RepID=A0ABN1XRZ2_9ACTN
MTPEPQWTLTADQIPDGQVAVVIGVRGGQARAGASFRVGGGPSALIGRGKREPVVVAFAGGPVERWVVTDRSGRVHPVETVTVAGLRLGIAVLPARARRVVVRRFDSTGAPDFELLDSRRRRRWPRLS